MDNPEEKTRARYLVVRLASEETIARPVLIKAIRKAAKSLGESYYEEVSPWLTFFENNYGVIKYEHRKKKEMLALVENLKVLDSSGKPVEVSSLGISGTINKARKKYIP